MSLNDSFRLRGMNIVILHGMSWIYGVKGNLNYLENLEAQNKELRKQLLHQSIKNQKLQESMLENLRLRRLLRLKDELGYSYIPATVIGSGQEQSIRSLILNAGKRDQVFKNQAVVTEQGVVGKILDVEDDFSVTQILMDRNSLVSARLQRSREVGLVGWSGNLWLDLYYIPKDIEVESGEIVVTSGLSQIYPKGLKIGIVVEVKENDYELFKQIKVKPAVNFNKIEEVFVISIPDSLQQEIVE
jgi:rod shape-determining protein MreC